MTDRGRTSYHIATPPEDLVIYGDGHGVQFVVNMPAKDKMIPPAYQSIDDAGRGLVASATRVPWLG